VLFRSNGPILLAVLGNSPLDEETEREMSRCFTATSMLRPMTALLGLSRARLLREARSYLPFWQTVPVIRGIARFLRLLFRDRPTRPRLSPDRRGSALVTASGTGSATDARGNGATKGGAKGAAEKLALQRYQKSIRALISSFVPPQEKLDDALDDLVEKWNPLLEPAPKQDLVRDVNALVQDFVRPIRRDFVARPPDLARITLLAEQLSASKSLAKIRNRDPLVRYIQLYMLRTLLG
jgi:hypothetical protein